MIPKIQNVLYATDLSKNSAYAFLYAVNTARKHDAKIHILNIVEALPQNVEALMIRSIGQEKFDQMNQDSKKNLRERIERRLKRFAEKELMDDPDTLKRVIGIHVVEGDPATVILDKTDELGCDTIIMGTHGKGALSHTFLGSVSEEVLRRIRKPVYIIPLPKGETDVSMPDI
jgi:nucleotide-binding universal stress UspA family protein